MMLVRARARSWGRSRVGTTTESVDHVIRPQTDRPVFQEGEPSVTRVQANMLEHPSEIHLGVRDQVLVSEEQVGVAQPGKSPGHKVVGVVANGTGERSIPAHLPILAWRIQPGNVLLPREEHPATVTDQVKDS